MTAEDKARDRSYRQKYGITLSEYEWRLKSQGGVCMCCKNPPKNQRLAVEHDHQYKYIKIDYTKRDGFWIASARYRDVVFLALRKKKNDASKEIREQLKRNSVRGLVCFPCNSGLRKFGYRSESLKNASEMMERFYAGTDFELFEAARRNDSWDCFPVGSAIPRKQVPELRSGGDQ